MKSKLISLCLLFLVISVSVANATDPCPNCNCVTTTTAAPTTTTTTAACPSGQHKVSGVCCPTAQNYVVGGICSSCPANQTLCGGNCVSNVCPSGKTFNPSTCSCEAPCKYKINFKWRHETDDGYVFRSSDANSSVSKLLSLSCMQKILCDCYVTGRNAQGQCVPGTDYYDSYSNDGNPLAQGYELLADECIVIKLADLKSPGSCGRFETRHWNTLRDKYRCKIGGNGGNNPYGCNRESVVQGECVWNPSAYVMLDDNCNSVNSAPANEICGNYTANSAYSPISLVWSNEAEKKMTLVSFPINPNEPNNFYTWEGSANMPLVVYDPEHTGKITSGAQLFGNWTWGGKREASMSMSSIQAAPWKHGFEALAEMDRDKNGKVDGSELETLGLWFDKNSDGISQVGEVVTMKDKDVTALFYNVDTTQNNPKEVVASLGFERTVDGNVVRGKAIDWIADGANSKLELAIQQQVDNIMNSSTNEYLKQISVSSESEESDVAKVNNQADFAGMWKWSVVGNSPDMKEKVDFGTLMVVTNPGELSVYGKSIFEVPLADASGANANKKLLANSNIQGKFEVENGKTILKFIVLDGKKVLASSTVRLSADGKKLLGTTTTGADMFNAKLTYDWEASRM